MNATSSLLARLAAGLALVATGALATACSPGHYVWYTELPPSARRGASDFVIAEGDTVSVRVLGHEEMNVHEKVRADGRIALPIIGEVEARGKKPAALRAELEGRIKEYIVSPSVLITVDDRQPLTITALGEVGKPGTYALDPSASVADALAAAGGLSDFAARDGIYVVRRRPSPLRVRFTYEWLSRNEGQAASFPLSPGDLLVVE